MMHLILPLVTTGVHVAGWRHPDAWSGTAMNLDHMIEAARLAERGKFDAVFLADKNSVVDLERPLVFEALKPNARPVCFEPVTLLAALARETSHLGLIGTATTSYEEPYSLARRFGSLDHLSGGRAGWNVVTSSTEGDAYNFSRDGALIKEARYERAREFIDVVFALWESWAPDAFPEDKLTGVYARRDRVRLLEHVGAHFQVKGPLNMLRPPQGRPVVFHAGQSPGGMRLASQVADCVFAATSSKDNCVALREDFRQRAAAEGRSPDAIRIIPATAIFVGRSRAEGEELFAELNGLIPPALGVEYLSDRMHMDMSAYDVDGPMPDLPPGDINDASSFRTLIADTAKREGLTVRQSYERILPVASGPVFKGSAADVADQMEDWYGSGACDGFMAAMSVMPSVLANFVELVVPELQRRKLFRTGYQGDTLREVMGLPLPATSWA